jgi:hypothetical protein
VTRDNVPEVNENKQAMWLSEFCETYNLELDLDLKEAIGTALSLIDPELVEFVVAFKDSPFFPLMKQELIRVALEELNKFGITPDSVSAVKHLNLAQNKP